MTVWDDRLLEIIREEESGSPTELSKHKYVRISRPQVSRRLKKLAEHGMLSHLGNGVYIITEKGEDYLDGNWDAEEDRATDTLTDENGNGNGVAESGSQG